jgi:hypothetical protein
VHQEEGGEDSAGWIALGTFPLTPVRIHDAVDVGEVVPLEDELRRERFFSNRFRLSSFSALIYGMESPSAGALGSSPILQLV